jgi:hypothetical protein
MEPKAVGIVEGWVTEESCFDSLQWQEAILFAITVANPTSYVVVIGGRGVNLIPHVHVVLRLGMVEIYFHSCLYGLVLN